MKMNKFVRFAFVTLVPLASLTFVTYSLRAQPTDFAQQAEQNQIQPDKHVELHFLRGGADCYVSGRVDKAGVLHNVVMRSYFSYKLRNPNSTKLSEGVFPEICLAKSMSPNPKVPNQWILEDAMYHIFKTNGTQLQETPTNAQQPKAIILLPVGS